MATKAEEVMDALTEFRAGDRVLVPIHNIYGSTDMMPARVERDFRDGTFQILTAFGYQWITTGHNMTKDHGAS